MQKNKRLLEYFAPALSGSVSLPEEKKKGQFNINFKKLAVSQMASELLGAEPQNLLSPTKVVEVKKVLPSKLKLSKNLES